MAVTVLCVGKLRERFYADAAQEYLKRLSRLMPTEVVELPDEKEPANPSPALNEAVMRKEGEAILRHIPPKAYVIALCIEGKQLSSEAVVWDLEDPVAPPQPSLPVLPPSRMTLSPAAGTSRTTLSDTDL